jgi:hypothetical protein
MVIPGPQPQHTIKLAGVLSEANQNLTAGQKLLFKWHGRFGHCNLTSIQKLLRFFPFTSQKFCAAAKCDIPRCYICEFAKSKRRPKHAQRTTTTTDLRAGAGVSVDHFESRLIGRTYDSYGKTTSAQYVGGCIFVDHGSGYIQVRNQVGFSAVETICAKQSYEQFALSHGVIVKKYLTDSGAFKANNFSRSSMRRSNACASAAPMPTIKMVLQNVPYKQSPT